MVAGVLIFVALVALAYAVSVYHEKDQGEKDWEDTAEGRMIRGASQTPVDPMYRPVLIYRYRGTNRPAFTAVGTLFEDKNEPLIITVNHLFAKKFSNELFVIRFLSPDAHTVTNGIESIVYRPADVGIPEVDVIFVRPGFPKLVECLSEKDDLKMETTKGFLFKDVTISGKVTRKLKSLVTGKEYPVIGVAKNPQYILIEYGSKSGESGTGFTDEFGRFYILSGSTRGNGMDVSFMSGPFFDLKSHY